MKAKAHAVTAALLAAALAFELYLGRRDEDAALAAQLIGPAERVPGAGFPAFRSSRSAVLYFERPGLQGPIRGALVVEGDRVAQVLVLRSVEGPDGRALHAPGFLAAFRGRPARAPIAVDAVSGASISSRALADAVNERLRWWTDLAK
ncbi:MAG: FMN-binding protein [Planctomycetes bacterium]|nr:FMN-binding protein [Planctomycetota bacterium]